MERASVRMQSGVIPYRIKKNGQIEVLLIRAGKNHDEWGIPKGGIERNMNSQASAAKEAYEEAGVLGKILKGSFLGAYVYHRDKQPQHVELYVMRVQKVLTVYPEHKTRPRAWVLMDQAQNMVKPELKKFMIKAQQFIEGTNKWFERNL